MAYDVRPLRRAIESHLGSGDVARVIYGSIIGLALVVALQEHPPTAATMASFLVGTAVAVGLAEVYSEYVGAEARTRRPLPITWALVSMNPSGVMTTPDPVPRRATRRFATDGPSFSATVTTTRE